MICNVNQDSLNENESLSTLRFGVQAGSLKLNIEKGVPMEKSEVSRTPSTGKEELRRRNLVNSNIISDLKYDQLSLQSQINLEMDKVKNLEKELKTKDMIIVKTQNNNKIMSKAVQDLKGIIENNKKKQQEEKKIKPELDINKIKRVLEKEKGKEKGIKSTDEKKRILTPYSRRKRNNSNEKLGSDVFLKKRFESKSRRNSQKKSSRKKPKLSILRRYNELKDD